MTWKSMSRSLVSEHVSALMVVQWIPDFKILALIFVSILYPNEKYKICDLGKYVKVASLCKYGRYGNEAPCITDHPNSKICQDIDQNPRFTIRLM